MAETRPAQRYTVRAEPWALIRSVMFLLGVGMMMWMLPLERGFRWFDWIMLCNIALGAYACMGITTRFQRRRIVLAQSIALLSSALMFNIVDDCSYSYLYPRFFLFVLIPGIKTVYEYGEGGFVVIAMLALLIATTTMNVFIIKKSRTMQRYARAERWLVQWRHDRGMWE